MRRQLLPWWLKKEKEIGRLVRPYLGRALTEITPMKRYCIPPITTNVSNFSCH